ncbi:MAG TPA: penicillin acylase family protein [Thermoleophilaceae bacterium]
MGRIAHSILVGVVASSLCAGSPCAGALAAPTPQPYQANDGKGFMNVLPPGQSGRANGFELLSFLSTGERPPHNDEQLGMYGDLVYAAPGLDPGDVSKYYKDASFGVKPEEVERTYSPRADVTIVRDKRFGRPSVYGEDRDGAMFGLGYVAAEDRLFFIDVLRHLGRAQLSSFAGGASGNRAFDHDQWALAPYTEEDLQKQVDQLPDLYGSEGAIVKADIESFTAGVNRYISEARLDPTKMPGEYPAIGQPNGPSDWRTTDIISTAALVGGIFGKGGGGELKSAKVLAAAQKRFGDRAGRAVWRDFRSAEDPEAPTHVHRKRFPYRVQPRKPRGTALPDAGTLRFQPVTGGESATSAAGTPAALPGAARCHGNALICLPGAGSNGLVVSARESRSGHPLAVFGPQTGYFAPQILIDQDVHAPATAGKPGIDATGAAFPGVNLYVELGRGRDYAWSATSAGQDNTDTFALKLCNPDGGAATLESQHYLYRGSCRPIEVLTRTNSWTPNAADQTEPGSETLTAQRTALGVVVGRATVRGKPVVYTSLRSTYFHEVDSALGFMNFNTPERMRNAGDFQRAANRIGYTFNWLYVDDRRTAYFNSGAHPVRGPRTDTDFPVWGTSSTEWRDWSTANWTARYEPLAQHPRVVDQDYMVNWNNKQARGYRAADDNFGYSSTYRVKTLDDRVKRGIRGPRKMTLVKLIDAMEDAGTVDLRGDADLPWALRVLGDPRTLPGTSPALRDAITKLVLWYRDGAHRRDRDRNGAYEHSDAIRIMDAWWPLWMKAEFEPVLGGDLFKEIQSVIGLDNTPNNHGEHLGSAYQIGWYGYARKDLRTILRQRVRGRYSRIYCGGGSLAKCRAALAASLAEAIRKPAAEVYSHDAGCADGDQMCFDAVRHRALGGVTQPPIHWINRPTFQQAVEVQGRAR